MTTIIPINKAYILDVTLLDKDENYSTGQTVNYVVRDSATDTIFDSGVLVEQTNARYIKAVTFVSESQYTVMYTPPSGYEKGCEKIITESGDLTDIETLLDTILDKVCKILGLSQSNYRLTNEVYNTDGCLLSANIYIYPTATDLDNDTNRIATYLINATYDTEGLLIDYTVKEV